ncbi:uncharacterized protein FA14DRAFT_159828 [Meira miltonrushii]|uniref:Yeast cell wall synthesis Kre9/Knh1-like N-terminal domain-containing protein n=1 Tax=Meira miltonrushii TaxID=1280837 RepID=A0A316VNV2_9BASI|nr:uncharacterized protein FA14DRAFT_159828 [Meira miltonrushii]PWN38093.1 hypothetical protein FA14DRAFT_159828 [Meira miltonrushii]
MMFIKTPVKFVILCFLLSLTTNYANGQSSTSGSFTTTTNGVGTPANDVGVPASDVGVPASDVGVPASDVGTPASDVGVAATQALPASYTDDEMTYHVAGKTSKVNGSDITITSPISTTTWIANATNVVSWTGTTPERLSIQLINNNTSRLESGLSLRASVETKDGQATVLLPNLKDGTGYYIRLYDQLDISKTLATSDKFQILRQTSIPLQTPSTADVTPLATGGQPGATSTTSNGTTKGVLPNGHNDASRMHSLPCLLIFIALVSSISIMF